ncbi:MAG TPA: glycoside hydrolase family 38 C-terminal domain-containing protein [Bacteroidota bacterium]
MKPLRVIGSLLFSFSLFHFSLFSQSNVDKLVRALDSLTLASYNDWKVSPDLKSYTPNGDPTKPGFDDSQWNNLALDQSIYPDSCWIRKDIVLPEKILGKPVNGPMRLIVAVDDYGYMWINGESKGYFPWDGDFLLTDNAKPGEKFTIAIRAINTGGPLRLITANIQSEEAKTLRSMIDNLSLSFRVGQKLLSFDTYQTSSNQRVDPGIDKSTMDNAEKRRLNDLLQSLATKLDLKALSNGPMDKFEASVAEVRKQLKPIADYAKRFTLYFDANAHIDAAWLWRDLETIEVCRNTFNSVFNMMKARPDFTYTQSAAAYYDWMEQYYPDTFKKMQEAVKEGRWEITGGMWVEPDCNLPNGVSWARHLLYAKRYFKEKFGVDVKIGWNPDSFGYNGNMPMLYQQAGIDAFVTQKIGWNATNVFPYRLFWWESDDGSKILSYFPFDYVNEVKNPYQLVDWMRQFEANTGMTKMMVLFGVGDHGGGPSIDMMNRIDDLRKIDVYPAIEYGNTTNYLSWVRQHDLSKLPVYDDELYLEYHQGTYTTQANTKAENRTCETLLRDTELYSSLAAFQGRPYNSKALESAWRKVLFNQFHDILPGSGIHENYIDAEEKYKQVKEVGNYELQQSLKTLANDVNTSKFRKGTPIVVFNPLSWERTDLVRYDLPEGDESEYAVFDSKGNEVTSQIVPVDQLHRQILFTAENVPSVGYETYELRKQKPSASKNGLSITSSSLENESFRVRINSETGWVSSIVDKRNNKELLTGEGNRLQLLEDKPKEYDAWNIGLTGVEFPSKFVKAEIVEDGPLRVVLRLHRTYLKPGVKKEFPTEDFPSSFFTQDIILYANGDKIDFRTDVDWWEAHTMLKVGFPLTVQDTVATYEIPFGTITRSTQMRNSWEQAKVEVPALRWVDLSQDDYGVSLIENSKYGFDIKGSLMRMSLLRSPKSPDRMADMGKHSTEYALYPHQGRWQNASTVRRAYEFNNRLVAVTTTQHKGKLGDSYSFVQLLPSNLILRTLKKCEDGNAWIFQWYNVNGNETETTLTLPQKPKKAMISDFLEEDGTEVPIRGREIHLKTKQRAVVSLKVFF